MGANAVVSTIRIKKGVNPDGPNMKKKTAWDDIKAFAIDLVRKKTAEEQIARDPSGKQFALQIVIFAGNSFAISILS